MQKIVISALHIYTYALPTEGLTRNFIPREVRALMFSRRELKGSLSNNDGYKNDT